MEVLRIQQHRCCLQNSILDSRYVNTSGNEWVNVGGEPLGDDASCSSW